MAELIWLCSNRLSRTLIFSLACCRHFCSACNLKLTLVFMPILGAGYSWPMTDYNGYQNYVFGDFATMFPNSAIAPALQSGSSVVADQFRLLASNLHPTFDYASGLVTSLMHPPLAAATSSQAFPTVPLPHIQPSSLPYPTAAASWSSPSVTTTSMSSSASLGMHQNPFVRQKSTKLTFLTFFTLQAFQWPVASESPQFGARISSANSWVQPGHVSTAFSLPSRLDSYSASNLGLDFALHNASQLASFNSVCANAASEWKPSGAHAQVEFAASQHLFLSCQALLTPIGSLNGHTQQINHSEMVPYSAAWFASLQRLGSTENHSNFHQAAETPGFSAASASASAAAAAEQPCRVCDEPTAESVGKLEQKTWAGLNECFAKRARSPLARGDAFCHSHLAELRRWQDNLKPSQIKQLQDFAAATFADCKAAHSEVSFLDKLLETKTISAFAGEFGVDGSRIRSQLRRFAQSTVAGQATTSFQIKPRNTDWTPGRSVLVGNALQKELEAFEFQVSLTVLKMDSVRLVTQRDDRTPATMVRTSSWGSTHLANDTYAYAPGVQPSPKDKIVMYYRCSGHSTACVARCETPLTRCRQSPLVLQGPATSRKDTRGSCACGMKDLLHRDVCACAPDLVQHSSHFECLFNFKVEISGPELSHAVFYFDRNNERYHQGKASQSRMPLRDSVRAEAHIARVQSKATAEAFAVQQTKTVPIFFNDAQQSAARKSAELKQKSGEPLSVIESQAVQSSAKPTINSRQVGRTMAYADQRRLEHEIFGTTDGRHRLSNSDWRTCELLLQSRHHDVVLFQRGDAQRPYMIVLASPGGLSALRKYGALIGIDTVHDWYVRFVPSVLTRWHRTKARFPCLAITYCGPIGTGHLGALAIMSCEDTNAIDIALRSVKNALPCSDTNCRHPIETRRFADQNGWFCTRPCGILEGYVAHVMHDKSAAELNAVALNDCSSILCLFHIIQANRHWISNKTGLRMWLALLLTLLKVILRSTSQRQFRFRADAVIAFITQLDDHLISRADKDSMVNYWNDNWLTGVWSKLLTAERKLTLPESVRLNKLLMVNNVTERGFRTVNEAVLNNQINTNVSPLVTSILDWLQRDLDRLDQENAELVRARDYLTTHVSAIITRALRHMEADLVHVASDTADSGRVLVIKMTADGSTRATPASSTASSSSSSSSSTSSSSHESPAETKSDKWMLECCEVLWNEKSGFCIACDGCQRWFHGRCVNASKAAASSAAKAGKDSWLCVDCAAFAEIPDQFFNSSVAMPEIYLDNSSTAKEHSTEELVEQIKSLPRLSASEAKATVKTVVLDLMRQATRICLAEEPELFKEQLLVPLPRGTLKSSICYTNIHSLTATCTYFVQTGHLCSHLYAALGTVLEIDPARPDSVRALWNCVKTRVPKQPPDQLDDDDDGSDEDAKRGTSVPWPTSNVIDLKSLPLVDGVVGILKPLR